MKRIISVFCAVVLIASLFAGCIKSQENLSGEKTAAEQTQSGETSKPQVQDQKTEIVLWHSFGTAVGEAFAELIDSYNASQDKVLVKSQFNGTYEETLNKFKASIKANALPNVLSAYDYATSYLASSDAIVPAQTLAEKDGYSFSEYEPSILNYYKVNGKVYSIPFNASVPMMYYNKDAFREAGLDPEKPPKTFDELAEAVKVLIKKDTNGKVSQYGMAFQTLNWYFVQGVRVQGLYETDAENGRTGGKITKVIFDENKSVVNVLNAWKKVVDTGAVLNFLSKPNDAINAFQAGTAAITFGSSGSITAMLKAAEGKFEVGAAFLPTITADGKGGVCPGGGSIWIVDSKDENAVKASWDFAKYLGSAEAQSEWHKGTGYLPVNSKAYEQAPSKEILASSPMYKIAADQLAASPGTPATYHPLTPVYPEIMMVIQQGVDGMFQNNLTPEKASENLAAELNKIIGRYNKTAN